MDLKILTGSFNGVVMAEKFDSGILLWLVAGLALGAMAGLMLMQAQPVSVPHGNTTQQPSGFNASVKGTNETAAVDITTINPPDCPGCRSLDEVMPQLRNVLGTFNLTIGRTTNLSASEGAALISKYGITKLPAMVLTGNFSEDFASRWVGSGLGTRENDGALVLRDIYPPYYENGRAVGIVEGIAIDAQGCPDCTNASEYFRSLEDSSGDDMRFSSTTALQENDTAAQALIAKYNITKLPVLLLSDDARAYPPFNQTILPFGDISGGWFVLRNVTPPYLDLQDGKVHGLVEAIFIVNSSCTQCFNVTDMSGSITQYMVVANTTVYEADSSAAKALIAKYDITRIPAILYSPAIADYSGFGSLWLARNSTIEKDGWYVFRSHDALGLAYQNVTG